MAMRSSWDGYLKLSLISVPIRAFTATVPGGGDIHFHQLHKDCGQRIKYQKVCPVHGEVSKEEIVAGYEYEKGRYVEIAPEEKAALPQENDQAINIDVFTTSEELDPRYFSGKTYYLLPDGPAGQKPYALLHHVMKDKNCQAIATVVMSGHDETVLLRPLDKLLTMTVLYYSEQIKQPDAFEEELVEQKLSVQELKLASTLVDASTADKFDFSHYKDHYTERTAKLVEAKLAGKKPEAAHKEKGPGVINLMEALRQSLDQARGDKPSRKRTPPLPNHPRHPAKRKTG